MPAAAARPLKTWTRAARAAKEALRVTVLDTGKVRLHTLYDGRVKTTARLEAEQVRTLWRHMTVGPRHLGTIEAERGHVIVGYGPTEADTLVTVNRYGVPREYKEFERKLGQNPPVLDLSPKPPVAYRVCLDKEVASALFGDVVAFIAARFRDALLPEPLVKAICATGYVRTDRQTGTDEDDFVLQASVYPDGTVGLTGCCRDELAFTSPGARLGEGGIETFMEVLARGTWKTVKINIGNIEFVDREGECRIWGPGILPLDFTPQQLRKVAPAIRKILKIARSHPRRAAT